MQFTACQPDSTSSLGRAIRRWEAKNGRPTVGSRSTIGHSAGPSAASGAWMAGAWAARPSRTASSRAAHTASKVVSPAAASSKAMRIPSGEIEPNAAITASGPAGASGAHGAAM